MLARFRAADQGRALGDALLDQTLVAGIGNMWKAESLFAAALSPWTQLRELSDEEPAERLAGGGRAHAAPAPTAASTGAQAVLPSLRRADPLPRQGDAARMAYWCPACQAGTEAPGA